MIMTNAQMVNNTIPIGSISKSAIAISSASVAVATATLYDANGVAFNVGLVRGFPVFVDFYGIGGSIPSGGFTIGDARSSSR